MSNDQNDNSETVQLRLFEVTNPLRERVGPEFFKTLPDQPGVYWMLDGRGRLLYVGKSRNLKQRVSSYRSLRPEKLTTRLSRLIFGTEFIRFKRTESETQALDVEASLLKILKPPCNTAGVGPENRFDWKISSSDDGWKIEVASVKTSEKNSGFRSPHRVFKMHGALLRQLHGLSRGHFSLLELPPVLLKGPAGLAGTYDDARLREITQLYLDGVETWPDMQCPMDPLCVPDLWSADAWDRDQDELRKAFEHIIRPLRLRQYGLTPEDLGEAPTTEAAAP